MPLSTDNQDYGQSDDKNKANVIKPGEGKEDLSSDDLKGKKIDADPSSENGKPVNIDQGLKS